MSTAERGQPEDPASSPPTSVQLNALGQLGSAVGHHVINAFSAIVSNAEMLRVKGSVPSPEEMAALADTIVDTAVEAATVARRLIDYTRPITAIGPDSVAIDRLVEEYVAAQAEAGSDVNFRLELQPVPIIKGHAGDLRSMLGHLLQNAREAATAGPATIVLRTSIDARGWVVLEIIDAGVGPTPEVLARAVEPFFTTKSGHTGVGLSIANGIWRRHKGSLALRRVEGEGTVVRLTVEPPIASDAGPRARNIADLF